jgi:hypothetical protein
MISIPITLKLPAKLTTRILRPIILTPEISLERYEYRLGRHCIQWLVYLP